VIRLLIRRHGAVRQNTCSLRSHFMRLAAKDGRQAVGLMLERRNELPADVVEVLLELLPSAVLRGLVDASTSHRAGGTGGRVVIADPAPEALDSRFPRGFGTAS
jgi:hypothetical protein